MSGRRRVRRLMPPRPQAIYAEAARLERRAGQYRHEDRGDVWLSLCDLLPVLLEEIADRHVDGRREAA